MQVISRVVIVYFVDRNVANVLAKVSVAAFSTIGNYRKLGLWEVIFMEIFRHVVL